MNKFQVALLAGAVLFSTASQGGAVGTRTFVLDSLDDLKGGDLTGVAIDSGGNVRAGLTFGATQLPDASAIWSALVLPSGAVLLGTGNDGKIFRVQNGQVTLVATTGEMAVSALALAWDGDVIAGTFPEGKLFRLPKGAGNGGEAPSFGALDVGTEDVWSLAFDPKAKVLYAATGPDGKLVRIDAAGKSQVYFDSDEAHLVSLAVADDGAVYAGSNGKALLYRVTGPGRASVVYDFDADDVKAVAIAPKTGTLWAVANKYNEAFTAPKRNRSGPPTPQPTRTSRPGKGTLWRFDRAGLAEKMLDDDDTHYVCLTVADDGSPYVGTGAEGRVYTVSDNHVERLVADTDERQVGALVMSGPRRFIASSDPAVFHEIKGQGGADAVWTSKVLDSGMRAKFGRLTWRSDGALEFSTRSGNTAVPDTTWSAWSNAFAAPAEISSPTARYVQVRARWARDAQAVLREVTLAFLTDNARAVVTSIEATSKSRGSGKGGMAQSGGDAPKASSTVKISWKVENPDQDDMRYRVSYRQEGHPSWRSALKPGEKLSRTEYDWDTSALPEGLYRVRVEASDEMSNPPDRVTRHTLESGTVLVDNTPPIFKTVALAGRRLTGEVVDGLGPIFRIEVTVAGSDEWRPIFPKDAIFDEATEAFEADLSTVVPPGSHSVAVRVYDSAGNSAIREFEAR